MTVQDWSNLAVCVASAGIIAWVVRDARQYAKRATVEAEQDAVDEATSFAIQHPIRRESVQEYLDRVHSAELLNNSMRWL